MSQAQALPLASAEASIDELSGSGCECQQPIRKFLRGALLFQVNY
jgi:hypothetical protein